jgi:hypothetical protein
MNINSVFILAEIIKTKLTKRDTITDMEQVKKQDF